MSVQCIYDEYSKLNWMNIESCGWPTGDLNDGWGEHCKNEFILTNSKLKYMYNNI